MTQNIDGNDQPIAVPGTRQMANENYGVCVQMQPGYCSIKWSQGSDSTSFTVNNSTALQEAIRGLPGDPLKGENCTTDYVVVPNPHYTNGTAIDADRFCGNQFIPLVSMLINNLDAAHFNWLIFRFFQTFCIDSRNK